MNRSSVVRLALVFLVLVTLHYSLRPVLQWRASVDFLLIGVMIVSVRTRPGAAALLGFTVGLLADVQSPSTLGSSALGLACVAFAAAFLKASFFSDRPALNAFLFFVGKLGYDYIFILTQRGLSAGDTVMQLLVWSPVAALVTALAGSVTLALTRPIIGGARG